jgi:putative ABC transport system substrate-binding protein
MCEGFIKTLNKSTKAKYTITTYDGNNDPLKMRAQTEKFVGQDIDLIFTVGAACSKLAKETTLKRNKTLPIVFADVMNPAEMDLVESNVSSGNHVTGIAAGLMPFKQQMEMMLLVKPEIKKAVLPYNPGIKYLEESVEEIKQALQGTNIGLQLVPVYQTNNLIAKVSPFLEQKPDVVIVLRDSVVGAGIEALAKLCNKRGITIFAGCEEAIEKGAAYGITMREEFYGIQGAHLAQKILEEGKYPSQLPIIFPSKNSSQLMINTKTMEPQNLKISPELWFIMKHSLVLESEDQIRSA